MLARGSLLALVLVVASPVRAAEPVPFLVEDAIAAVERAYEAAHKDAGSDKKKQSDALEKAYAELATAFFQLRADTTFDMPGAGVRFGDAGPAAANALGLLGKVQSAGTATPEQVDGLRRGGLPVNFGEAPWSNADALERFRGLRDLPPGVRVVVAARLAKAAEALERRAYPSTHSAAADAAVALPQAMLRTLRRDLSAFARHESARMPAPRTSESTASPVADRPALPSPATASETERAAPAVDVPKTLERVIDDAELRQKLVELLKVYDELRVLAERHGVLEPAGESTGDAGPVETIAARNARLARVVALVDAVRHGRTLDAGMLSDLANLSRLLHPPRVAADAPADTGEVPATAAGLAALQAEVRRLAAALKPKVKDAAGKETLARARGAALFRLETTDAGRPRVTGPGSLDWLAESLNAWLDRQGDRWNEWLARRAAESEERARRRAAEREARDRERQLEADRRASERRAEEMRRQYSQPSHYGYGDPYGSRPKEPGPWGQLLDKGVGCTGVFLALGMVTVVGGGIIALVRHSYSDRAYIDDADRDYHSENAPKHVENLLLIAENGGTFNSDDDDRARAVQVLRSRFSSGYDRLQKAVDVKVARRLVAAAKAGKLGTLDTAKHVGAGRDLVAILDGVAARDASAKDEVERMYRELLEDKTTPVAVKAAVVPKIVKIDEAAIAEQDRAKELADRVLTSMKKNPEENTPAMRAYVKILIEQAEKPVKRYEDLPFDTRWAVERALRQDLINQDDYDFRYRRWEAPQYSTPPPQNAIDFSYSMGAKARASFFLGLLKDDEEFQKAIFSSKHKRERLADALDGPELEKVRQLLRQK